MSLAAVSDGIWWIRARLQPTYQRIHESDASQDCWCAGLASSPSCAKKDWSFRHLVFGTLGNIGNEHFGRRKRAHVHQHSLDVHNLGTTIPKPNSMIHTLQRLTNYNSKMTTANSHTERFTNKKNQFEKTKRCSSKLARFTDYIKTMTGFQHQSLRLSCWITIKTELPTCQVRVGRF